MDVDRFCFDCVGEVTAVLGVGGRLEPFALCGLGSSAWVLLGAISLLGFDEEFLDFGLELFKNVERMKIICLSRLTRPKGFILPLLQ